MKAFVVILCWLLIGFFYWSMSQTCCTPGADNSKGALIGQTNTTSTSVPTVDTVKNSTSISDDTTGNIQNGNQSNSTISTQKTNSGSLNYDHSLYNTITEEHGISNIPLKTEDPFNDEIKAHLEQVCTKMNGNLSKLRIVGYNKENWLASKTGMKMENFLIRCGVSPFRISRSNCTIDTSESHIKMFIID